MNLPTINEVSTKYGAPHGRGTWTGEPVDTVILFRVPLDHGGYDDQGAYWGTPDNLWCATDSQEFRCFVRADTFDDASDAVMDRFPVVRSLISGGLDIRFEAFFAGYIEAALCSSHDYVREYPEEVDGQEIYLDQYDGEIAPDDMQRLRALAQKFFIAYNDCWSVDHDPQAGHDLWLSSAGHGSGFFDRPEIYDGQEIADALTEAARDFHGEVDLYIGDDGRIYASGGKL